MKRGGFGSPYRAPADGWPRKIYSTGLYSNIEESLNGLARYANNTQITLQPGQVGRPMTKPQLLPTSGCERQLKNGMPYGYWIGIYGDGSYLPSILGGRLKNTFAQNGTTDRGANCRQRGGKWVQAGRSWHGAPGWLSHEAGLSVVDTFCNPPASCDSGTVTVPSYESYQPNADQKRYRTVSFNITLTKLLRDDGGDPNSTQKYVSTMTGSRTVDFNSGQIASSQLTTEDDYDLYTTGSGVTTTQVKHVSGGVGWTLAGDGVTQIPSTGMTTLLDAFPLNLYGTNLPTTLAGVSPTDLLGFISYWNTTYPSNTIAAFTNLASYSASSTVTFPGDGSAGESCDLSMSRNDTNLTWNFMDQVTDFDGGIATLLNLEVSMTLSDENDASAVYADAQTLLNYWPLSNDALYPFRTDGVWQVAPLVTREENGDTSPIGFNSYTVDDKRSPIADANGNAPFTAAENPPPPGWTYSPGNNDSSGNPPTSPSYGGPADWNATYTQMAWFDPNAYGFVYGTDPAANKNGALAIGWKQYALTGKILGMPMPQAFIVLSSSAEPPTAAAR